ncbi:MAG: exodeoxyribonuclease VII small subunit [Patescibacteria group bacterium]|nr:exodeoxyribonuclease VII small subunit [Patescibacteria group bacterium]
MAKSQPTYEQLNTELEKIVSELQQDTVDIDTAIEHYQRGLQLVKELEVYLENATNNVQELKAAFTEK